VREERESLAALTRRVVLDSGNVEALWRFWDTSGGADDAELVDPPRPLTPALLRFCGVS
jgi:hypothetical protein